MGETGKVKASRWDWVPAAMPKVSTLLADRRQADGADWVAHCWRRGVVGREPGFFWAAEGPLAIGTPIDGQMVLMHYQIAAKQPGAATLDMATRPEGWAAATAGQQPQGETR